MFQRINAFIEKRMAFVTPTCLVLGVCFPDIAGHGVPFVPYVFAIMTFTGSLKSTFADVFHVFRHPKPLVVTLVIIHIVMPLAACGVGHLFFRDDPDLIAGMVLEFCVPTAVVALMWVSIYGGNSPLSLSLVVTDTIMAPFIIPAALHIFIGSKVEMDTAQMMKELVFMIAIPALAAMCLNKISHDRVKETWPSKLALISKIALMFVVTSNASKVAPYVRDMNMQRFWTAVAILVLAASGYAVGWLAARIMKKDREMTVSMIYGAGMRNISAGAVIAAAYFPGEVMFPVIIGTLFQQVLAACYGKVIEKRIGT